MVDLLAIARETQALDADGTIVRNPTIVTVKVNPQPHVRLGLRTNTSTSTSASSSSTPSTTNSTAAYVRPHAYSDLPVRNRRPAPPQLDCDALRAKVCEYSLTLM